MVIYAPVWINEFSPAEANTRWMAGFHSACIIGIISGYLTAQIIVNYFSHLVSWRLAIKIQAVFQLLLSIVTVFVDNKNIDCKEKYQQESLLKQDPEHQRMNFNRKSFIKRIDTIDEEGIGNFCDQIRILLTNYVFLLVTLCLCSVYFVVTGIQFWTTAYMIKVLHEDVNTTMIMFTFVAISAPVAGVAVGSAFSDFSGGYKGENLVKAIKL